MITNVHTNDVVPIWLLMMATIAIDCCCDKPHCFLCVERIAAAATIATTGQKIDIQLRLSIRPMDRWRMQ